MKSWSILLAAATLEIVWAAGLKSTAGFTRLWPSVGVIAAMAASRFVVPCFSRHWFGVSQIEMRRMSAD